MVQPAIAERVPQLRRPQKQPAGWPPGHGTVSGAAMCGRQQGGEREQTARVWGPCAPGPRHTCTIWNFVHEKHAIKT